MENKFWCFTVMQCKCKMKNWIIFSGPSFLLAIAKKCQKSWWLTIHFNSTQNLKIVLFGKNGNLAVFHKQSFFSIWKLGKQHLGKLLFANACNLLHYILLEFYYFSYKYIFIQFYIDNWDLRANKLDVS